MLNLFQNGVSKLEDEDDNGDEPSKLKIIGRLLSVEGFHNASTIISTLSIRIQICVSIYFQVMQICCHFYMLMIYISPAYLQKLYRISHFQYVQLPLFRLAGAKSR